MRTAAELIEQARIVDDHDEREGVARMLYRVAYEIAACAPYAAIDSVVASLVAAQVPAWEQDAVELAQAGRIDLLWTLLDVITDRRGELVWALDPRAWAPLPEDVYQEWLRASDEEAPAVLAAAGLAPHLVRRAMTVRQAWATRVVI